MSFFAVHPIAIALRKLRRRGGSLRPKVGLSVSYRFQLLLFSFFGAVHVKGQSSLKRG